MSTGTKIGHGLAKALCIQLNYREYGRQPPPEEVITRGESVFSVSSADTYVEQEPTVWEWIDQYVPRTRNIINYFLSLFPFLGWIHRYNAQWLLGDLVAGMSQRAGACFSRYELT